MSTYHFKFENLEVYQKAMGFGEFVNDQIHSFPEEEKYRLASQFMRAADSIALNIAEGASGTNRQFLHFLSNAYRSLQKCVADLTRRLKNKDKRD